jgi:hypothetical protein
MSATDISLLSDRVNKLAEEVASQKTVGELIKYLVYFWAAISAALGLFGWSKFSDIDKIIEQEVQLQLPRDKQEFARFSEMATDAQRLRDQYKQLAKDYEESVAALQLAKTVGVNFDIEGKLVALIEESTKRKSIEADGDLDTVEGTLLEPKWRKEAIATLSAFKDSLTKKSYPADFIFNVTQVCRRLDQFELAEQLTKAAYEKDPTPPVKALYFSSRVQSSTGQERSEAFRQLMEMVEQLPANSPEIVIAEAWNAAEGQRRHAELIAAIDKLISRRKAPPSYALVIKAQALLRQSNPGALASASKSLDAAKDLLAEESAMSSWFESTLREYMQTKGVIDNTAAIRRVAIGGELDNLPAGVQNIAAP